VSPRINNSFDDRTNDCEHAEEDLDEITADSDPYQVGGVVQTCINCDEDLTVDDVAKDTARCKKNSWAEPTEFVCQEDECQKFRRSVSCYQAEENEDTDEKIFVCDGQRQTEDGLVRGEEPLLDFIFATKHELGEVSAKREPGEVGVPSRDERTDQEIHRDTRRGPVILLPRCREHGTPGCKPCKINEDLAQHYEKHPEERTHNGLPKAAPKCPWADAAGVPRQPPIEMEVTRILEQKRIAKLAKRPPKPSVEVRREKEQHWVKKVYDNHSLRRLHGYAVRQLADLLDSPRFNPKKAPVFTPGQVDFYRDYARGKTSKEVLEARVADGWYGRKGFERPDYLKKLEDDLVNRAWVVGLLDLTPVVIPGAENDEDPHAPDTDTEDKMMRRGGVGDLSIVSEKFKDAPGKTHLTDPMSTFERGWITKRVSGGGGSGGSSGRGPDYDEESGED
jgi:hypothetical protein